MGSTFKQGKKDKQQYWTNRHHAETLEHFLQAVFRYRGVVQVPSCTPNEGEILLFNPCTDTLRTLLHSHEIFEGKAHEGGSPNKVDPDIWEKLEEARLVDLHRAPSKYGYFFSLSPASADDELITVSGRTNPGGLIGQMCEDPSLSPSLDEALIFNLFCQWFDQSWSGVPNCALVTSTVAVISAGGAAYAGSEDDDDDDENDYRIPVLLRFDEESFSTVVSLFDIGTLNELTLFKKVTRYL